MSTDLSSTSCPGSKHRLPESFHSTAARLGSVDRVYEKNQENMSIRSVLRSFLCDVKSRCSNKDLKIHAVCLMIHTRTSVT